MHSLLILFFLISPFILYGGGECMIPQIIWEKLIESKWEERVGDDPGIWISIGKQKLLLIQQRKILFSVPCSTALKGSGNKLGSHQTPLGWHAVAEKIGEHLPLGAIFKERQYTGAIWRKNSISLSSEDLILTRILWLKGLEGGINQGTGIDSYHRYIYIHGTDEEHKIGEPASHGCVRISNHHIIHLFDLTKINTPVLITNW
jgi:hypothetical protein